MIEILQTLLKGVGTTISITLVSFLIGAALAIPLVLMRRSNNRVLHYIALVFVEVVRAIPPIVWLFLIYYGISIGRFKFSTYSAAVIGFGIIAAAFLSEVYRAALKSVPTGQWEAAGALALRQRTIYRQVVLPQAVLLAVPPAATYAIGLLKDSAIASVIGANDVTFYAFQEARTTNQGLTIFIVSGAIYLLLSVPVAAVARLGGAWLERKLTS
jgi:polar amino acid transport system permease protein